MKFRLVMFNLLLYPLLPVYKNSSTQIFVPFVDSLDVAPTTTTVAADLVLAINDNELSGNTNLGVTASNAANVVFISGSSTGTSANLSVAIDATVVNFATAVDIQGGTDSSVGGQDLFTIEVLGNGPTFNSTSSFGDDNILLPLTSSAGARSIKS